MIAATSSPVTRARQGAAVASRMTAARLLYDTAARVRVDARRATLLPPPPAGDTRTTKVVQKAEPEGWVRAVPVKGQTQHRHERDVPVEDEARTERRLDPAVRGVAAAVVHPADAEGRGKRHVVRGRQRLAERAAERVMRHPLLVVRTAGFPEVAGRAEADLPKAVEGRLVPNVRLEIRRALGAAVRVLTHDLAAEVGAAPVAPGQAGAVRLGARGELRADADAHAPGGERRAAG